MFGAWSTHQNLGHILGSCVIALLLDYGFEYGMLFNSVLLFYGGVLVFFCLIPHPSHILHTSDDQVSSVVGYVSRERCDNSETDNITSHTDENESTGDSTSGQVGGDKSCRRTKEAISLTEAFGVPSVLSYSVTLFFAHMVSSGLLFWLPTYFSEKVNLTEKESVWMSNMLDVGYIIGSVTCGIASDVAGVRSPVLFVMLAMSSGCLYLFNIIPTNDLTATGVVMVMTGILLGGPTNIIHTSVCADLGKSPEVVESGKEATATMTGIVAGTGMLGAAIGQFFIGMISEYRGWEWVFYFLIVMVLCSCLSLLPLVVCEVRGVGGCRVQCKLYDELPSTDDETEDELSEETSFVDDLHDRDSSVRRTAMHR